MIHRIAFVVTLVSGLVSAQGAIHIVDVNEGPNADYVQIADAVAGANDGDTLLVRAGGYEPFAIDGKSLTITREKGFDVRVAGTITVRNLSPTQRVVVHGLRNGTAIEHGLLVENCTGVVWFEDCEFAGASGQPAYDGVHLDTATQVVLVRGRAEGGIGSGSLADSAGAWGGDGIESINSNSYIWSMGLQGHKGGDGDDIGGWGGNGLFVRSNAAHTAFVAGSRMIGADGGRADGDFDIFCGCEQCGFAGPGGDGLRIWGNPEMTLIVRDNAYTPGQGGVSTFIKTECLDGADGVEINPDNAIFVEYPGGVPRFSATSPTREGALIDVKVASDADDLVTLMISTQTLPIWFDPLLGVVGVLPPIFLAPLGVVGIEGTLSASLPAPTLPAGLESAILFAQPIHLGLDASVELSTPSALILLDDAF